MRREDEALLEYFRRKDACEWCCRAPDVGTKLDPHHIKCRGLGGGSRLDVALNLLAVHRLCHFEIEQLGEKGRERCLDLVAIREGLESGEVVWDAIMRLLRQPKKCW